MEEKLKKCSRCGRELPLEAFHANRTSKDGRQSYCKECVRAASKASRDVAVSNVMPGKYPELQSFTPRQLMEELAARGFHAKGTITREFSF